MVTLQLKHINITLNIKKIKYKQFDGAKLTTHVHIKQRPIWNIFMKGWKVEQGVGVNPIPHNERKDCTNNIISKQGCNMLIVYLHLFQSMAGDIAKISIFSTFVQNLSFWENLVFFIQ